MVALMKLKEHGGPGWQWVVHDYLRIINDDPERYARMLEANRGERKKSGEPVADSRWRVADSGQGVADSG
jgi:hypothetical protein